MSDRKSIYELPQQAVQSLSGGSWPQFLESAAWNFRFPFQSQLLIYAQRPDARSCYSFEDWHRRFQRRIRRGAKGIALIDDTNDQLSLDYVFDYGDTYSRRGHQLTPWQMTQQKEGAVREALTQLFAPDVPESADLTPYQFFQSVVYSLLEEEDAALQDLMEVQDSCRLQELEGPVLEGTFRAMVVNSATAMIMHRCGFDPGKEQPKNAFAGAEFFDSLDAMSILGNTTQHIAKQILREIALTISRWDKQHENEEEKEHENEHDISEGRGVSDPQPDTAAAAGTEQIRTDAEEISADQPSEPIHEPSSVRDADGTPAADERADTAPGGTDSAEPHGERSSAEQGAGEPAVDEAHGNASPAGRGTDLSGDNLYLNFFSAQDIGAVLLAGPNIEGGKFRIQRAVEEDVPNLGRQIADEYGQGGRNFLFSSGVSGRLSWDSVGLAIDAPGYQRSFLTWTAVCNRIRDLVSDGIYLDAQEKIQSERYFVLEDALHKRQEHAVVLDAFFSIHGPRDHESIVRNNENIRAFVYENSKTARQNLLVSFGALVDRPSVQQDAVALNTLTELLTVLGDNTREEFAPEILSAADLGVSNPFPSEEEVDASMQQISAPLDREPVEEEVSEEEPPAAPVKPRSRRDLEARRNYKLLESYAPYILDGTLDYVRFESESFEPLYIERIAPNEIAIAHTYIQNGDMMRDPEITFLVDPAEKTLHPLTYEQSDMGLYQRVYDPEDVEHQFPVEKLEHNISSFFRTWRENLQWQGHEPVRGVKYTQAEDLEFVFKDGAPALKTSVPEKTTHTPEPYIDHPELVTDRHFPPARADKELLADLLTFIFDYRVTFSLHLPELSEHDKTAFVQRMQNMENILVTDSIVENLTSIKEAQSFMQSWFVPFSDGVKAEILEQMDSLLDKADSLRREDIEEPEQDAAVQTPAQEDAVKYDETSFHVGDLYEDDFGGGIISSVYPSAHDGRHEAMFGYHDPNAVPGSRAAKGFVMSIPAAIERLNRGEATLTPAKDVALEPKEEEKAPEEPTLFDFQVEDPQQTPAQNILPQPEREEPAAEKPHAEVPINFRMPETAESLGGPKARFQSNVAAIRLLKELEAEGRLATAEEQQVLSKYVGWGGIPEAFDNHNASWAREYEELKDLLDEEEYAAARASTLTAFYTPPEVIDAVYSVLDNLGLKKGNILDPGCGTGGFSGRLPESMSECKVYGVEKDDLSGRIARQLYQKNNITIDGYENTGFSDNFFDVAVGNVPFGDFKVRDKRYDKLNLQIHDYFFAKTLDKVRPGGVIAFVTSMGTMDKKSQEFRRYLSQRADLLGAIRLPNNTFKTNAGTDVTSDIIFLQKRELPRVDDADWVMLDNWFDSATNRFTPEMNSYFVQNPEMILGEMKEISGPHGPVLACIAREGENLRQALMEAAKNITGAALQPEQGLYDQEFDNRERIPADPDVRNYSFTLVDDEIYFREDSEMYQVKLNKTAEQRVRGMIGLRQCVRELIDAQMDGESDEVVQDLQAKLNEEYDAFTQKYGLINSRGNEMAFSDDSSYYLLCSLEHVNDKGEFLGKADMFYKRTIRAHEVVEHVDSASDALAVSLGELGRIDFLYMSGLSGLSKEELTNALRGQIFQDPTRQGHYVLAAQYLSGNVRKKLEQARAAEAEEPGMWTANIQALESVLPKDLEPGDITVRLGSTWIPAEDYTQFMYELFNTSDWYRERRSIEVQYTPYTNTWNIKNINWDNYNSRATSTYGTQRVNGYKILENSLNLKDVKVYDTVYEDGKERRVLNQNDTLEAQEKQQLIKDAFKEWIWSDPDRTERLCKAYNEQFNSYVPPKYDGSVVQYHNQNPNVAMRPWQSDAVARIMYNGNTLLAHAVGAGKTWTMSAAAMEMKHLGLCNKSLIVVPNHLVGQWASAIYDQYPNAKVLASTKKDFETKNRKKFCSRIATGDYDIVVIGHSQFERIPLSVERQKAGIQDEINKILEGIDQLKREKAENFTIKQMERTRKSLEARLEKLTNSKRRDDVITFEELGVDRLFVDESHEYKNLFLYTKMQNVAGISQTDSQKASDMYLKCRYIDELTGGKGIIHATGTPLSNTMAELYATQRYLQYDLLEEMGLGAFDQWASTFGETVTSVELAPEGTGYRARTRFANFFNIPELMSLYCQVADIQTSDMLDLPLPTPHYEVSVVPASEIQADYVKGLGERAQKIRDRMVRPEEDNMLKITSDGRKLALDQRLIDSTWPDNPGSKVNACADNIYRIWNEHADTKGTQLVFCDISTPNNKTFNVYDDLKEKLVARGIPEEEIRFVHEANSDAQKEALFQKVRDGEVRILMGSTGKMGTGTNVQDLLVAGHDLDCPWRPSDLEQRAGRVIRQGNTNDDVYMYRYVTEGTFDAYMYQLVENKQRFISQIYTSKPAIRQAADVDEIVMSFAEIKALASGNPLIKERVELEGDIQRLQMLQSRHENAQYRIQRRLEKELPAEVSKTEKRLAGLKEDLAFVKSQPRRTEDGHFLSINVKSTEYEQATEAGEALLNAVKRAPQGEVTTIGSFRGFTIQADLTEKAWGGTIVPKIRLFRDVSRKYSTSISDSAVGMVTRLNNVLDKDLSDDFDYYENKLRSLQTELQTSQAEYGKPFPRASELKEKQIRLEEVSKQLDLDAREDVAHTEEIHTEPVKAGEKPSLDSVIHSAEARKATQTEHAADIPEGYPRHEDYMRT